MTTLCTNEGFEKSETADKILSEDKAPIEESLADKYDLDKCADWIIARGLERVCLQFPDGLLKDSAEVALQLEKRLERKVYILGDTTCGSCCVDEVAADHVKADAVIHFGHACLNPTARLVAFHILEKRTIDTEALKREIAKFFKETENKIVLFYDVAYAHAIETLYESLKSIYPKLRLSRLCCESNIDFVAADKDSKVSVSGRTWTLENGYKIEDYDALYLGDNGKTLASLALSIPAKKWYHSRGSEISEFAILQNPWLKRRRFLVEKLKDARTVGIVVATLGIKDYLEALNAVKRALKEKNKKTYMFSVGKPNPAKLANFAEVDVFVVIACPESEIFDTKDFYRPLLTPFEVELAFNESREFSTHYCLDFRQILPGGSSYVEFRASEASDVSLTSGRIRSSEKDNYSAEKMDTVAIRDSGAVAVGKAGASFLQERSWKGLEVRLGEDEVRPAEKGRSGLPTKYSDEPVARDS